MNLVATRKQYLEFLTEQFAALGEIASRPMFGGHMLYCGGVPFAIVARGTVFVKTDEQSRGEFEARGLRPFQPFPEKTGVMSYYEPPPEVFEDADALKHWVGGAIAAGKRAQVKKKPSPGR